MFSGASGSVVEAPLAGGQSSKLLGPDMPARRPQPPIPPFPCCQGVAREMHCRARPAWLRATSRRASRAQESMCMAKRCSALR